MYSVAVLTDVCMFHIWSVVFFCTAIAVIMWRLINLLTYLLLAEVYIDMLNTHQHFIMQTFCCCLSMINYNVIFYSEFSWVRALNIVVACKTKYNGSSARNGWYVWVSVSVCVSLSVYVCVCVCVYIHIVARLNSCKNVVVVRLWEVARFDFLLPRS